MRLDKILENIKAAESVPSEKIASETPSTTNTRDQLLAALSEATTGSKVASAGSPVNDLMKIASEVAETEQAMALKEAQLLGHAFADAVVARVGEWQAAAVKTASHAPAVVEGFDKFASENTELIKQAAEVGYTRTRTHLEKVAAAEYDRGYNETMTQVQKLAAEEFAKAAQLTGRIIDTLAAR